MVISRHLVASLALGALAALTGCYGSIPGAPAAGSEPVESMPSAATSQVAAPRDPGRVTLHRLNRLEYDRTVADLLGTRLRPGDDFPPDDSGFGFDNNADALAMSPLAMELYERAAERLIAVALLPQLTEPFVFRVAGDAAAEIEGIATPGEGVVLFAPTSRVAHQVHVPVPGTYRFVVDAFASDPNFAPGTLRLRVGQSEVATVTVDTLAAAPGAYAVDVPLEIGPAALSVELLSGELSGTTGLRPVTVLSLGLEGPADFEPPDPSLPSPRQRLLVCEPTDQDAAAGDACARSIIAAFLPRAWRRPVDADEVDALLSLYTLGRAEGLAFEDAVSLPLTAALISPSFLFRVEDAPPQEGPKPTDRLLSDYELASRLSYFLWSSMPDGELFDLAAAGALHDPATLAAQVDRMLADPRADALLSGFVGQWLFTRAVDELAPDVWIFPDFDPELRASMRTETELFFRTFLTEERPLTELISGGDTFIDDRLAAHYDLPPVGPGFVRITDAGPRRGGLLRQAGILAVLSHPNRTSPVRRGKWVLEQLLCDAPDPPPPGVDAFKEDEPGAPPTTLREKMEQHRVDPVCKSCHKVMDPIGLGLEHYDGIGAWRDTDQGLTIDATGELPGGATFDGTAELLPILSEDPRLPRCVSQHLYTYALGRGPTAADDGYLDDIAAAALADGLTFHALVKHIVTSEPFRMRRSEPEPPPAPAVSEESL
ncbi:MAG: DUF1592 domain-containing protein [Myxococcota bacterium]